MKYPGNIIFTSNTEGECLNGTWRCRNGLVNSFGTDSRNDALTLFARFSTVEESYSHSTFPAYKLHHITDHKGKRVHTRINASTMQATTLSNLFVEAPSSSKT